MPNKKIVITGAAGFIGMHLSITLKKLGFAVHGIDSLNASYGNELPSHRSRVMSMENKIDILNLDLALEENIAKLIELFYDASAVIHLAAWPGVRMGQQYPFKYSKANLNTFNNVFEAARIAKPSKLLFASSSSIYGELGSGGMVSEQDADGKNLKSFYAATKWANEILAQQYSRICEIPVAALRFFTVYGEFGRPDMAYWNFLESIISGREIQLYGQDGGMRDFTYVSDVVEMIVRLVDYNFHGFQTYNISHGAPEKTRKMVEILGELAGVKPRVAVVERPNVDVTKTWGDPSHILNSIGSLNRTSLEVGMANFFEWYIKSPYCEPKSF